MHILIVLFMLNRWGGYVWYPSAKWDLWELCWLRGI